MTKILFQCETRVRRTYRGGKLIDAFLGKENPADTGTPEDWISSFVEAKNRNYTEGEGLTEVSVDGGRMRLCDVVSMEDLGPGRSDSGVLMKLLDAGERLGIQVHPTAEFATAHFGVGYGKTECWHILATREKEDCAVYIGFKEGITKTLWRSLYERQDIDGMLAWMHRIPVKAGDTVLVRAGTPHAIGAGCFLLEIQEPTDFTMRVEKTTVSGEVLTPHQLHYGAGEEALFECFLYDGISEAEARSKYVVERCRTDVGRERLVGFSDTPCFALEKLSCGGVIKAPDSFVTLVVTCGGDLTVGEEALSVRRGDKLFVPYGSGDIASHGAEILVCYPPTGNGTKPV